MTTPTVVMRPLRWWDIPNVMEIEHELFGDESWTDTMFWSELAERESRWYVVIEGHSPGSVAGYAGLCVFSAEESYVQTIAVQTARQGEGLGSLLLDALLTEAAQRGCERVDLEVRADNQLAQGLYERRGFERIGLRRGYYQPSGTDAVVMRKMMSAKAA